MNPIISPWLIYFISTLNGVNELTYYSIIILGMALMGIGAIYLLFTDEGMEFDFVKKGKHKVIIFLECLFILMATFIPSKETIYAMVVAKYVTPNNIEMVGGSVKDSIDYIFEKIDTLTKEEDEK